MKFKIRGIEIEEVTAVSYLTTALWSSTVMLPVTEDELIDDCMDLEDGEPLCGVADGEPLDDYFDVEDFDNESLLAADSELSDFFDYLEENDLYDEALEYANDDRIAHDFWLTRNGHGAGFWDGDYGDCGDALTAAAKTFGSSDIGIRDDGSLYLR